MDGSLHNHVHSTIHFAHSPFSPLAMSFFGLALGYVTLGGQRLFQYPPSMRRTQAALGAWALYGPGLIQTVSATVLLVGLTWFGVFESKPSRYVLALAFLVMAAHWVAMGVSRLRGANTDLEAWWGFPMFALVVLTAWVQFAAGDIPIAIGFVLLAIVYVCDILAGFHAFSSSKRVQGAAQLVTGCWMMYLGYAVALTFTGTLHVWM